MTGVVVGISAPNKTIVGHLIPFFAGDFARFATNADSWVGEKPNRRAILHIGMLALVRALDSFADHN